MATEGNGSLMEALAAEIESRGSKITRNARVRLIRDSVIIFEGKVGSLRRFKDDVKEVMQGYECGIGIENFSDVKIGDVIEAFEVEEIQAKL